MTRLTKRALAQSLHAAGRTVEEIASTLEVSTEQSAVWDKGESFNSKRPFGNSGWRYDLYAPLIRAGILSGTFDEDEGWEVAEDKESEAFVREMICAVFYGGKIEGAA